MSTRAEEPSASGKRDPGERPGVTIGRYVIVSRLGEGAMGMVYLAYDPQLDRRVALKVLRRRTRSSRASRERQQRLRREAQAMAQLNHANVITVHDVGVADGRVFLAMDYVEGQTLRDWLDARRRPWRQALRTLIEAGRGLAAAHDAGVVHRDFKPENVLVGNDGSVKVMDFGLARPRAGNERSSGVADTGEPAGDGPAERAPTAAAPSVPGLPGQGVQPSEVETEVGDADEDPGRDWWKGESGLISIERSGVQLTRSGDVLGTPSYMAPELFEGGEANASTDQFAFCVALYEALHGVRPFAGETMAALAFNTSRGSITPPPRGHRVPAWLGRLVRRGLSTQPERRYPSMQALLDALVRGASRARLRRAGAIAAGLVVLGGGLSYAIVPRSAPCRGGEEHLRPVWNEERAAAIAAAFEATGVTYADEALARARQRLDDYASSWVGVYTEVCEATAVHGRQSPEELDRRIACLDERLAELDALLQVLGEADQRVTERAAQAASELRAPETCAAESLRDPEGNGSPEEEKLRASMRRAEALDHAGRYDDAAALAREVAAEAELRGEPAMRAESLVQLGLAEDSAGNYVAAAEHLRKAYFVANEHGLDRVAAEAAVGLIGTEGIRLARGDDGLSWGRHAEAALDRLGPDDPLRGQFEAALGGLAMQRLELVDARKHYEKALAIERAALGDDHERVAMLLTYLGVVLEQQGRSEDAVASFEQAIEIHRRVLGPEHPQLTVLHNNYAVVLFGRQDWAGAQAQLEQALAIQRKVQGDHPGTALFIGNLGSALILQGKIEEGRALMEEALAMNEKLLGPEHPDVALSLANLAEVVATAGDLGGARRLNERALSIMEKLGGPDNERVAQISHNLGMLDLHEGMAQRGHDRCQRAVEILEQAGGPNQPSLPEPLMCVGWAQLELQQTWAALTTLERAMKINAEGQKDYGALVRLLLARALVATGGDAQRAAALRGEARKRYKRSIYAPPERVAGWLREPG
ncbi:serine/threonine-protein kinase [Paraliomyxa miuraensis]|uniref:serine/threonine-protein kinase n=1 Tax=Paraliomyxa miuraensis TaxID=376150 RepID=UPI00225AF2B5|nr:serine/threonine-protein kinase [Paraliomyxa miuraensis]MCX4239449.1 serine/threonine-protein kinase [Paraliomyxa miuraensis]